MVSSCFKRARADKQALIIQAGVSSALQVETQAGPVSTSRNVLILNIFKLQERSPGCECKQEGNLYGDVIMLGRTEIGQRTGTKGRLGLQAGRD